MQIRIKIDQSQHAWHYPKQRTVAHDFHFHKSQYYEKREGGSSLDSTITTRTVSTHNMISETITSCACGVTLISFDFIIYFPVTALYVINTIIMSVCLPVVIVHPTQVFHVWGALYVQCISWGKSTKQLLWKAPMTVSQIWLVTIRARGVSKCVLVL